MCGVCGVQGGVHGYFGLPPEWTLGTWVTTSKPCADDVWDFLTKHGQFDHHLTTHLN